MDSEGDVTLHLPGDEECQRLGHITGDGDYEAPPELWCEWARLRTEWCQAVRSSRAERGELEATYRSQKGF